MTRHTGSDPDELVELCKRDVIRAVAASFERQCATFEGGASSVEQLERITIDPVQMGGVPCIRGLRIPVATVLRLLGGGLREDQILAEYPDLGREDVRECLRFAAATVARGEP
ncbi:MAG: DUF433 domain-containing protein [Bryobacteraceae bacterium]